MRVGEVLELLEERAVLSPQETAVARTAGASPGAVPSGNAASDRPTDACAEPAMHEILLASAPAPVLSHCRERLLGPLARYDATHNAELLPTLESFLACDGSWSACAAQLYVHVNTVRYRISRIEALTGRDLSALADRVDFFLALRAA